MIFIANARLSNLFGNSMRSQRQVFERIKREIKLLIKLVSGYLNNFYRSSPELLTNKALLGI